MMSDVLCNRVSDRVALLACALGDPTMPNYLVEVAKLLDAAARLGLGLTAVIFFIFFFPSFSWNTFKIFS
jgi:hypothetical protein